MVENYYLRQPDQKRKSVEAFRSLNFKIIAAGDSYNDTTVGRRGSWDPVSVA